LENPYGIKGATRLLEAWEVMGLTVLENDGEGDEDMFVTIPCQAAGKPKGFEPQLASCNS
jgi:hypothetical protein